MPDRQRFILDAVERYNASDKFFADADQLEKDLVDLFELIEFDDMSMSHGTGRHR